MMRLTEKERVVLTALQRGVEPVERPFRGLALPEDDVAALVRRARKAGLVRRFGGVFDARRLGYRSMLCALDVDARGMAAAAAILARHPGVTHCYERRPLNDEKNYPALWFTLAMPWETFDGGLNALRAQLGGVEVLRLPALRRFKIDVMFDLRTRARDEVFPGSPMAPPESLPVGEPLTAADRALVRRLDQQAPLSACPFNDIARSLDRPLPDLLATLQRWKREGILRRIAVILHHRQAGYQVNGMCVWPVEGDGIAAGRRVAARDEVTHCYQRPRLDAFPFDLYAMIHTASRHEAVSRFDQITAACGLPPGLIFASCHEFKKSSMTYFANA